MLQTCAYLLNKSLPLICKYYHNTIVCSSISQFLIYLIYPGDLKKIKFWIKLSILKYLILIAKQRSNDIRKGTFPLTEIIHKHCPESFFSSSLKRAVCCVCFGVNVTGRGFSLCRLAFLVLISYSFTNFTSQQQVQFLFTIYYCTTYAMSIYYV